MTARTGMDKMEKELAGSFSSSVKTELAMQKIRRREDALALVSAFTLSIGSLTFVSDRRSWGIHYALTNRSAIELVSKLISRHYSLECRLSEVEHERLRAHCYELLAFGEGLDEFLMETGFMSVDEAGEKSFLPAVPETAIRTETQKRLFVRGLFLACGTVTQPEKGYHAELVLRHAALADRASELLSRQGIEPKRTQRRGSTVLYIKEGERLEDLLAYIGASEAMMVVSNERIVKQAKNKANRDVNCITANLTRSADTARKQAEDIELVLKTLGAEALGGELVAVASARLNGQELSLSELADELGFGRSAVNYRLKKLEKLAKEIRGADCPPHGREK